MNEKQNNGELIIRTSIAQTTKRSRNLENVGKGTKDRHLVINYRSSMISKAATIVKQMEKQVKRDEEIGRIEVKAGRPRLNTVVKVNDYNSKAAGQSGNRHPVTKEACSSRNAKQMRPSGRHGENSTANAVVRKQKIQNYFTPQESIAGKSRKISPDRLLPQCADVPSKGRTQTKDEQAPNKNDDAVAAIKSPQSGYGQPFSKFDERMRSSQENGESICLRAKLSSNADAAKSRGSPGSVPTIEVSPKSQVSNSNISSYKASATKAMPKVVRQSVAINGASYPSTFSQPSDSKMPKQMRSPSKQKQTKVPSINLGPGLHLKQNESYAKWENTLRENASTKLEEIKKKVIETQRRRSKAERIKDRNQSNADGKNDKSTRSLISIHSISSKISMRSLNRMDSQERLAKKISKLALNEADPIKNQNQNQEQDQKEGYWTQRNSNLKISKKCGDIFHKIENSNQKRQQQRIQRQNKNSNNQESQIQNKNDQNNVMNNKNNDQIKIQNSNNSQNCQTARNCNQFNQTNNQTGENESQLDYKQLNPTDKQKSQTSQNMNINNRFENKSTENQFGHYDSQQQQANMDRIDAHFLTSSNRLSSYRQQIQNQQNSGKLFSFPQPNSNVSQNISHNQMMKPLGGAQCTGIQGHNSLALGAQQKISASTGVTGMNSNGDRASMVFGNDQNSNPNYQQHMVGDGLLNGKGNLKESNENIHIHQDDTQQHTIHNHRGINHHNNLVLNQQQPTRHSDQLLSYPNPLHQVEQRALQEVPVSSLNDMYNRQQPNRVNLNNEIMVQDQDSLQVKKLSTSSNRLQSGSRGRVAQRSQQYSVGNGVSQGQYHQPYHRFSGSFKPGKNAIAESSGQFQASDNKNGGGDLEHHVSIQKQNGPLSTKNSQNQPVKKNNVSLSYRKYKMGYNGLTHSTNNIGQCENNERMNERGSNRKSHSKHRNSNNVNQHLKNPSNSNTKFRQNNQIQMNAMQGASNNLSVEAFGGSSAMRPFQFGCETSNQNSIGKANKLPTSRQTSPPKIFQTPTNVIDLKTFNAQNHPSINLPRETTTDEERQNINVRTDLMKDIDRYQRDMELKYDTRDCLLRHAEITGQLRARMVDWMIEVLTNFRCDDQTFFLSVSLMDRYFKNCKDIKMIGDLHITGVTSMFVASKYEDIYPLKMKIVFEKIAHQKLEISAIKALELDIMKTINYKIHAPTVLDFLKGYLLEVLNIEIKNKTETKKKEENALKINQGIKNHQQETPDSSKKSNVFSPSKNENQSNSSIQDYQKVENYLIEKMTIYLAKMSMHDTELSSKKPSLLAVGSIYVALKICEQLKKKELISSEVVERLINVSKMVEEEILDVSQKVLYLAQNFDKEFPDLKNLKQSHFKLITDLL